MSSRDDEIVGLLNRLMTEQQDGRVETNSAILQLDKKLDLHIQKTSYELKLINDQDEIQNKLLDAHIAGVNTLKMIHEEHVKENETRFKSLEEPRKFLKTATKVVVWLGSLGVAVVGILEAISWMKGH